MTEETKKKKKKTETAKIAPVAIQEIVDPVETVVETVVETEPVVVKSTQVSEFDAWWDDVGARLVKKDTSRKRVAISAGKFVGLEHVWNDKVSVSARTPIKLICKGIFDAAGK
jgi:hypothetical protein